MLNFKLDWNCNIFFSGSFLSPLMFL